MGGILDSIDSHRHRVRRGELDTPMAPHARSKLHAVLHELDHLHRQVKLLGNEFLAYLISTAADEARDQLRDDLIIRNEAKRAGDDQQF